MTNRPLAIIQSRIGSTRLPGKALAEINGIPLTEHVVRRVHRVLPVPVLALPESGENDELAEKASGWPCRVVRGPEEDVLGRFIRALEEFPESGPIMRVTGDNPLISYRLMANLVNQFDPAQADYATWRHLPYGLGAGIFTRQSLMDAHKRATGKEHREHVTLWIKRNNDYQGTRFTPPEPFRAPGFRLTVDTDEDLQLIRTIHKAFPEEKWQLSSDTALTYLSDNPEIARSNREIRQEVYSQPSRILYAFNQGGEWGRGHRIRFERFRSQQALSEKNLKIYGIAGGRDQKEQNPSILVHSRNELTMPKIILWTRRGDATIVVLDIKDSSQELVQSLKEEGVRVIGIEDRGPGRQHMDAVIDPNIYSNSLPNDPVPSENRYYGPDYAILDPEFRKYKKTDTPETIKKIGVFFGGTDPNKLGTQFLKEALAQNCSFQFHHFGPKTTVKDVSTFREFTKRGTEAITFHGFVGNPAEHFSRMDFMVIAGGVTKFEVACLNCPAMVIAQNNEQYENTRRFLDHAMLDWPLFPPDSPPQKWITWLQQGDFQERARTLAQQTEPVVDGRALERFYKIIDKLAGKF